MTYRPRPHRLAGASTAALLAALASACTLPVDEARHFRAEIPALAGRPVQDLERQLGPPGAIAPDTRSWGVIVVGTGTGGDCDIEASVDANDRIRRVTLSGSDYGCGTLLSDLRRRAKAYAADPALAERQRQEQRALLEELARLRREQPR